MYYITKTQQVRLDGGRSVVLREGPRGKRVYNAFTEEYDNQDAGLEKALGSEKLQSLIASGLIEDRPDAE